MKKTSAASEVDLLDSKGNRESPKHSRAVRAWERSVEWTAQKLHERERRRPP